MALFGRTKADEGPPDDVLPFLSVEGANRVRSLMSAAFSENGLETAVYPDHLVDQNGRQFGVYNVGAACHNDPRGEKAWPEIIGKHVATVLRDLSAPSPLDTLPTEQVMKQVYPRLYETAALGKLLPLTYAPAFSDDVTEVLNLDLPESVLVLNDAHVEKHGGRAALHAAAIENLFTVLPDLESEPLRSGEASLLALTSSSMFTASTVLVMPELLATAGLYDVPHGVLVCMPFRFQVGLHVIRDLSVIPSLNAMVRFAASGFGDGVGPLTPHVFWWHEGTFEQLTRIEDGEVSVLVGGQLGEILNSLT